MQKADKQEKETGTSVTKSNKYVPNMKLRLFVQALFHESVKGDKTAAEKMSGVRREYYYYHLKKDPEFRQWYSDQCSLWLASLEVIISHALVRNILRGSSSDIKTYFQLRGKLKNDVQVATGDIHIGNKNETHVTNVHDNQVVVGHIEKLTPEQRGRLLEALKSVGLIKGDS